MPKFLDNQGREWFPRVTVSTLRKVEERTGLCLFRKEDWRKMSGSIGASVLLAYFACERRAIELWKARG